MNNKLISLLIATSFASLFTVSALSAPVANLKISGDIKPPTCTVNGSNDADLLYSFGDISPSVIPQNSTYRKLPSLTNNLTVICDADTFLTFKATDNYPLDDILPPGENARKIGEVFSLVDGTNTSNPVGIITFQWNNVSIDGNPAFLSRSNDSNKDDGIWTGPMTLINGSTNGWTSKQQMYVGLSELDLVSGKIFSVDISNSSSLTQLYSKSLLAKNNIDISEGVDFIGQAVLTFNFGI